MLSDAMTYRHVHKPLHPRKANDTRWGNETGGCGYFD
jgi:hypothetical protein